jgi:hypothetical protein
MRWTIHSLRLAEVIYLLLALLCLVPVLLPAEVLREVPGAGLARLVGVLLAVLLGAISILLEVVVKGLQARAFWAWAAGLVASGVLLASPLLPLGGLALWGLLRAQTLATFGVREKAGAGVPACCQEATGALSRGPASSS